MRREQIISLMPDVYQRSIHPNTPLDALIALMENLHMPTEQVLQKIDTYFCPYSAPDEFIPYLAKWVDLERYIEAECDDFLNYPGSPVRSSIETGRLRVLISIAAELSQWRGTARGLMLFLQTATGIDNFKVEDVVENEENGNKAFHIRITAPSAARSYKKLIEKIINGEKPAYVTSELVFEAE